MLESIVAGGVVIILLAIAISFIPAIVAFKRDHAYKWIILVLCFFAPTVIIWLIAFIWAIWPADKSLADPVIGNVTGTGERNLGHTLGEVSNAKKTVEKQYDSDGRPVRYEPSFEPVNKSKD